MVLTLEVISVSGRELPAARQMVFRATGGTIGRAVGNDWILPDQHVSSRHARITYMNGEYQLEDTSTNGVFINSPDNRLGRGNRVALKTGDLILIEPYEIQVSLGDGPAADKGRPLIDDPFGAPTGGAEVDPLNLLGLERERPVVPGPRADGLANQSVLSEHFTPPKPVGKRSPGGLIPDDYDPLSSGAIAPRRVPAPEHSLTPPSGVGPIKWTPRDPDRRASTRQEPAQKGTAPSASPAAPRAGSDLAAVLEGAGLGGFPVSPEVARDFGRILRIVVAGLMDILQSRHGIKSEFRMEVTSFQPMQNNPLKFSANVEDALHNLLIKKNPAYLAPVDAFEDAFEDLKNHQLAMLQGVRAAFDEMLKTFDPDHLQQEFDKKMKGSLISGPANLRYWKQYRTEFSDMVSDADKCFRDLFGDAFAKAYEEQLEELTARKGPRRPRS